MKARQLRKILGDSIEGYKVADHGRYIAVGSGYCHDLISVDKETLKLRYALDTFKKGRAAIDHEPLEKIWDTLTALIESGEIKELIDGQDEIPNPITVYTAESGTLVETLTDRMGYPNVTIDGKQMYDNTHFESRDDAIERGIANSRAGVEMATEHLENAQARLIEVEERLQRERSELEYFTGLKSSRAPTEHGEGGSE